MYMSGAGAFTFRNGFSQVPKIATRSFCPKPGAATIVDMKGKGRGVIATRAIKGGKLVEKAPIIKMKKRDRPGPRDRAQPLSVRMAGGAHVQAFPLGFAGLLNHSSEPNCTIERDMEGETLDIHSLRDIKAGEELTWDYGIDPWFKVTESQRAAAPTHPSVITSLSGDRAMGRTPMRRHVLSGPTLHSWEGASPSRSGEGSPARSRRARRGGRRTTPAVDCSRNVLRGVAPPRTSADQSSSTNTMALVRGS